MTNFGFAVVVLKVSAAQNFFFVKNIMKLNVENSL